MWHDWWIAHRAEFWTRLIVVAALLAAALRLWWVAYRRK